MEVAARLGGQGRVEVQSRSLCSSLVARAPLQANVKALADATSIDTAVAGKIKELLADPAVVKVMAEQKDLDLDDNSKLYATSLRYPVPLATQRHALSPCVLGRSFLDKIDTLAAPGYTPTEEDILNVRDPTRTIETLDFQFGKAKFRVIDVGGQRMERPKWNLTGEITAVIFVCSLIEYTQARPHATEPERV